MIYKHTRTGILYRWMFESFDTATQNPQAVYVSLKTGQIFNRDVKIFDENFEFVEDCQSKIQAYDKGRK